MSAIKNHTNNRQRSAERINIYAAIILGAFLLISPCSMGQVKQLVQIKTFDQQLKPLPNIDISINEKPYISMGSKAVAFTELAETELPPKSVTIKSSQLEAASWNYSKGTLEIIIRKKSYRLFPLYVKDANNSALRNIDVTFIGKKTLTVTTDKEGKVGLLLGLDEHVSSAEQFRIPDYHVVDLQLSEKENTLTANRVVQETVAQIPPNEDKTETVAQPPAEKEVEIESDYFKDFDLSKIDSIQSLTVFYAIFKNYAVKDLNESVKQKLDTKFNSLVQQLQDSHQSGETNFVGRISDSSFVSDDIKNLIDQAILENQILEEQRRDFDEKIKIINEKLAKGGQDLDEATKTKLLSDLALLERLLQENEDKFYRNQNNYRTILNALKEKFFHIEVLEKKLSMSEAKRLEEQRIFRKKLFTILSISLVFALLVILLVYFSYQMRKQKKGLVVANGEIKRINENLENLVNERTKLLKETNRELDLFLYRASHDLRSPVTSIIGLCNIAAQVPPSEAKVLFEKTGQTAHAMDRLLKKLRVISEINQPGDFSSIELRATVEAVKEKFASFIQEHKIDFTVDCPADLSFYANPTLTEAILFNLLENAVFYSTLKLSGTPRVQFTAGLVDDQLEISVYDNGIGIEPGIRDTIFDMFFIGHERSKGNGLGLYIVEKCIHAMKGRITVDSEYNAYTRFVVNLPMKSAETIQDPALVGLAVTQDKG